MSGDIKAAFARWKIASMVSLASLALLLTSLFIIKTEWDEYRAKIETNISLIGHQNLNRFQAWHDERMADAALISNSVLFVNEVADWFEFASENHRQVIRKRLVDLKIMNKYVDVALADVTGKIVMGPTGERDATWTSDEDRVGFDQAFREGKPVMTDIFARPNFRYGVIDTIAPLFREKDGRPVPFGAVIFRIDPEQHLYPLLESWPESTRSGETILVRKDGERVLYITRLRFRPSEALSVSIPLERSDVPGVMAVSGKAGVVKGIDYRGEDVVASIQPVLGTPWYIVTKMDISEAYEDAYYRVAAIALSIAGLILGVSVLIGFFWQRSHKKNEEVLRRQNEYFRTIFESNPSPLYVFEIESLRILAVNDAMVQQYGYSRDEFLTMTMKDIRPPEDIPRFLSAVEIKRDNVPRKLGIWRHKKKDGTLIDVDITVSEVFLFGKHVRIGHSNDVTHRLKTQHDLEKAKLAADAANEAKSRFLANVSHELRTPMNAIIGMTELALDEEMQPSVREYLKTTQTAADGLLVLLNELLDLSRIEAGKFSLECGSFNLRQAVDLSLKTIGGRAFEKGIELICDIGDDVPDNVVGDGFRVRQIVNNIVDNAVKFTDKGEVYVKVDRLDERMRDRITLKFSVEDTGVGIGALDAQRIFKPFVQGNQSDSKKVGGSGLGLAIVQNLVELMGGQISVDSRVGKGSKFIFTLNLGLPQDLDASKDETSKLTGVSGLHTLVIEDNETQRRVLERILSSWGMSVQGAASVEEALVKMDEMEETPAFPHVVIVDGLIRDIERLYDRASIRNVAVRQMAFVLLTSPVSRSAQLHVGQQLQALFVDKPVSSADLARAVITISDAFDAKRDNPVAVEPLTVSSIGSERHVRQLRILLAEDNAVNQIVTARILNQRGHKVEIVDDGRKAFERVMNQPFDLILMDIQMPVMDGLQVTAAIRALPDRSLSRIPIIAVTAYAMATDREKCLAVGMDDFVAKPIESQTLFKVIENLREIKTA